MSRIRASRRAFVATVIAVAGLALSAAQVLAGGGNGPFPK
jgi:hypothetical protein